MKRIALSMLLASLFGVAQADTLAVANGSVVNFNGYGGSINDGGAALVAVTGAQNTGSWGSLFTAGTTGGTFSATYLGNESGYTNSFTFGFANGTLTETSSVGSTISQWVNAGTANVNFSFADSVGQVFYNGDQQGNPFGFVIMNGTETPYGTFDYLLGFNDSWQFDADYDDYVVGVNFVSAVPEPETYAMFLAGLGLLGMSVRRRKSGMFD